MNKLILITLTLISREAFAKPDYSKTYLDCSKKNETDSVALRDCMTAELTLQDLELKKIYQEIQKLPSQCDGDKECLKSEVKRKNALKEAQQAWVAYRQVKCDPWYSELDRESSNAQIQRCELEEVADRVSELKAIRSDYMGEF